MGQFKKMVIDKMDEEGCSGNCDCCKEKIQCHKDLERAAEDEEYRHLLETIGGCHGCNCDY